MWRVALILLVAMSTAGADAPRPTCDAKALEQAGDDAWQRGDQVLALDKFEKAAQCQETTARHFKAAIAACELFQHGRSEWYAKKARYHYARLPKREQEKVAQACTPRCRLEN